MPNRSRLSLTRNPDSLPTALLEDYEPEGQDPVGEGAFAVVRLARHRRTGELFALKCVEKHQLRIRNMLGQMQREVRIHQALRHPNILQLLRVFDDEIYLFMLLEYCAKGNLRALVERSPNGRLPEPQAARYFMQIVQGVDWMHRNACVHRDLKLENMLLTAHDELKICDFGWSAEVEGDQLLRTICGTRAYWAPEIWEGAGQSESVDMWALGCLLYEMLAGQSPFQGMEQQDLCRRVLKVHFTYPAWFSSDACSCVRGLLQRDPQQRTRCADLFRHPWLRKHAWPVGRQHRASEPPLLPPPPPKMPATALGLLASSAQKQPKPVDKDAPLPPPPPPPRQTTGPIQRGSRLSMLLPAPTIVNDSRPTPGPSAALPGSEVVRAPRSTLALSGKPGQPATGERHITWDVSQATSPGSGCNSSPRVPSWDEATRNVIVPPPQLRSGRQNTSPPTTTVGGRENEMSRSPTLREEASLRHSVASPTRHRPMPTPMPAARVGEQPFTSPRHPSPGVDITRQRTHSQPISPEKPAPWANGSAPLAQSEPPANISSGQCTCSGASVHAVANTSPMPSRIQTSNSFGPMFLSPSMPPQLRMQLPAAQSFPSVQLFASNAGTPFGPVPMRGNKAQSFSLQSPKGNFHPQSGVLTSNPGPRSPVPTGATIPRSPRSLHSQSSAPPPQFPRNSSGNLAGAPPSAFPGNFVGAALAASAQFRPAAWGF